MMSTIFSLYLPQYPSVLAYMLQSTEYRVGPYLRWYWRTQDFSKVANRRQLEPTTAATALLAVLRCGMLLQILVGLLFIYLWHWQGVAGGWAFGLAFILAYPVVWAHLIVVPLLLARFLIIEPRQRYQVLQSEQVFRKHKGAKIAIVGSYGKTTMKEILRTVLGEAKNVAATPANRNVAVSHAQFAKTLSGEEDILLIEYGEGAPGDVDRFARITHPTHAVITGVAAAHLDRYKTVEAAGQDIFSVTSRVKPPSQVYVNSESSVAHAFLKPEFQRYDQHGALGWKVDGVIVTLNGLSFRLHKGKHELRLKSGLIGRHNLGPLSLASALAHDFAVADKAIVRGVSQTQPFEHRMQPYQLHGAWIIDDTYNGNLEGIRAGTALLKELSAKRKLYVTPGLVDQGDDTAAIHEEVGRLIAASGADVVILMHNSVTTFIQRGLSVAKFNGELKVERDPLTFYTNLGQFVAAGDVVLMQNDWPDNYA